MSFPVATVPNEIPSRSWFARLEIGSLVIPFLLTVTITWSVTRSLEVADWTDGLTMLTGIGLMALITGMIFARVSWMPAWLRIRWHRSPVLCLLFVRSAR